MKSTELCSLQVQKIVEKQENIIQTKNRTDRLLERQKRGQAKANTQVFRAAGAVGAAAAPVPSNLAWTGGG